MKGTTFQNGVEYKVTIEGESWQQGQSIQGQLQTIIRNTPAGSAADAVTPRVVLAESTERKIKSKSAEAFSIIEEASSDASVSTTADGPTLVWKFTVPRQARITDKAGSLFLLYGFGDDLFTYGQLKLNILPHHYLQDIIEMMRTEFRFALKKTTAGRNGWIDTELDPPDSKDWAQLDHLVIELKLEGEGKDTSIEAKFQFHRAEVDGMKAGLSTKLTKREVTRSWPRSELVHDFNDRLDKDAAQAAINDVVEEYRNQGWLA
ncbi:MAG: hypothetical protein JST80_01245 [Bdellovibrionales bacterium]|nr:hypothetical protein [Bdellovibrionales bacterium]